MEQFKTSGRDFVDAPYFQPLETKFSSTSSVGSEPTLDSSGNKPFNFVGKWKKFLLESEQSSEKQKLVHTGSKTSLLNMQPTNRSHNASSSLGRPLAERPPMGTMGTKGLYKPLGISSNKIRKEVVVMTKEKVYYCCINKVSN